VKAIFACRPKPLADELLSSWLLRTALHNGMKPQSFCKMLWPDRTFWNRSIDRYASAEVTMELAAVTGTSLSSINQLSLSVFEGILFPAIVRNGNTPWILPLGIFHRKFLRTGLVYCPLCLGEGEPYFRRRWRFSFATVCLHHGTLLQEECTACHAPIQPHRLGMGNRNPYTSRPIYLCSCCLSDLRLARFDDDADTTQCKFEHASSSLLLDPREQSLAKAAEHFAILRHILGVLGSRRIRLLPFRAAVACELTQPLLASWSHQGGISLTFDAMPIIQRRISLAAAYWLLEDWPERFLGLARKSNLRVSDLTRDFPCMPWSYGAACAKL
jgi:hypothetical protein